jgi:ribosome biogenesis protein BMS1
VVLLLLRLHVAVSHPIYSWFVLCICSLDIVFLRAWTTVKVPKFYHPITSLLESDKRSGWLGMQTHAQVRKRLQLRVPNQVDSRYRPVKRTERRFNALQIPKKLEKQLPYSSKPKLLRARKSSKPSLLEQRRAVVLDRSEKRAYHLVQQLNTLRNDKMRKEKAANLERKRKRDQLLAKEEARKQSKHKERGKAHFQRQAWFGGNSK